MRKPFFLVFVSAFAAACGGGSSSSSSGGEPTPLAGTIAGHAFTPTDVKALVAGTGSTPCTIPNVGSAGLKAFAIELTSYPNACGDFANASCEFHQSAQTVTLLFAKLNAVPPGAEPTLVPGTYAISASPTVLTPESVGVYHVCYAQAIATDATCSGLDPTPLMSVAGTLRIDQVTGPVTGHVSVTFVNPTTQAPAGSLDGDFSAPLCTETVDVCGLTTLAAGGTGTLPPPELFCSTSGATCTP